MPVERGMCVNTDTSSPSELSAYTNIPPFPLSSLLTFLLQTSSSSTSVGQRDGCPPKALTEMMLEIWARSLTGDILSTKTNRRKVNSVRGSNVDLLMSEMLFRYWTFSLQNRRKPVVRWNMELVKV